MRSTYRFGEGTPVKSSRVRTAGRSFSKGSVVGNQMASVSDNLLGFNIALVQIVNALPFDDERKAYLNGIIKSTGFEFPNYVANYVNDDSFGSEDDRLLAALYPLSVVIADKYMAHTFN